ncbi:MAG: hypothetical protein R2690_11915 [Acidimicrobiales bacterium]
MSTSSSPGDDTGIVSTVTVSAPPAVLHRRIKAAALPVVAAAAVAVVMAIFPVAYVGGCPGNRFRIGKDVWNTRTWYDVGRR